METEYKYRINDASVFDSILDDQEYGKFVKNRLVENVKMHAVYFDTDTEDLRKRGIAYRIRYENDRIVATIKWGNKVVDGLHVREEFNLVINDEKFAENPNIDVFLSSGAYEVLHDAVGNKQLTKTVEMEFERRQARFDTGKSISALSIDKGVIHRRDGDIPIHELEIEWYYGDEEDFKSMATKIAKKFELEPEDRSKLQRAFQ